MDQDRIITHWFEYISELYKDNRGQLPYIKHALKRKPPGPNGVLTKILVAVGEYGLEELTRLTNMVFNHGYFPEELIHNRAKD